MSSLHSYPILVHDFKYVENVCVLSHNFEYIFKQFVMKYQNNILLKDVEISNLAKSYYNNMLQININNNINREFIAKQIIYNRVYYIYKSKTSFKYKMKNIKISLANRKYNMYKINNNNSIYRYINIYKQQMLNLRAKNRDICINTENYNLIYNRIYNLIKQENNIVNLSKFYISKDVYKNKFEQVLKKFINSSKLERINIAKKMLYRIIYYKLNLFIKDNKLIKKALNKDSFNINILVCNKKYLKGTYINSVMKFSETHHRLSKIASRSILNNRYNKNMSKYYVGYVYNFPLKHKYMSCIYSHYINKYNNYNHLYKYPSIYVFMNNKKIFYLKNTADNYILDFSNQKYLYKSYSSVIIKFAKIYKGLERAINKNILNNSIPIFFKSFSQDIKINDFRKYFSFYHNEIMKYSSDIFLRKNWRCVKKQKTKFLRKYNNKQLYKLSAVFLCKYHNTINKVPNKYYLKNYYNSKILKSKDNVRLLYKYGAKINLYNTYIHKLHKYLSDEINIYNKYSHYLKKFMKVVIKNNRNKFLKQMFINIIKNNKNVKMISNKYDFKYISLIKILKNRQLFKRSIIVYKNNKYKMLQKYIRKKILKSNAKTKMLDLKLKWFVLEPDSLKDRIIIPNIDYPYENIPINDINKHPISSVEDINYKDVKLGDKEINVSIRIMQQMLNFLFIIWNGKLSDFSLMTTTKAIEEVMVGFYTWLMKDEVRDTMIEKGSREEYLRVYRWFRWEAEKVWIQEKNDVDNTGIKSIGVLVANIIEYMKIHHYNVVPITNKDRIFIFTDILRAFTIYMPDYFKNKLDKTKGKRKYCISTKIKRK